MAQSGYTPIQLYRTATASTAPTAGNLSNGEIAINYNTADMALYAKNSGGSVIRIMNNPAGLKYPTVDGTSGQVIKTDGAGNLSWVSVTSGTVTGTGTTNYVPKWTGSSAIGNSVIYDDGTNVGIGTSSPTSFGSGAVVTEIKGTTTYGTLLASTTTVTGQLFATEGGLAVYLGSRTNHPLLLTTSNTERMRIDSSGNVGIGVTPSAWGSGFTALQNTGGAFWSNSSNIHISQNNYYNGTNYIYTNTGYATRYQLGSGNGSHSWYTAASGTAGNAVSFTQAMTLSGAGGLSVGTTADPGAGAIYATGNITAYYSDDRLKTRKGNIENALDKVLSLDGFHYEANETAQALGYKAKPEVGLSAQQVQAVLPEVVVPAPIDEKYLTVHYERLIPLLVEAIKELNAKLDQKCECCK